ncbi:MAG TPA: AAA family ATPase [Patescibacteria group bacterium]
MSDYKHILQQEIQQLKDRVAQAQLPPEMGVKVQKDIIALERSVELGSYDEKYEKVSRYIEWLLKIPWQTLTPDTLDIEQTKQIFDKHHYGMQEVKDRFLEYVSVLKLRRDQQPDESFRAPILLLVGLVGTGKTTFAYSLAEALGRKIVRIPFGGMGSAKDLRGNSRLLLGSEPGRVIKGLCEVGTRNPIILLDEIDRVAEEARRDIMGVLVELLDPAQNHTFVDNYIDYPVDLSQAIFLATANNTTDIATAVLDRMEKISMPSYTDQEKMVIAQRYILPKLMQESGLTAQQLIISEDVWPKMVRPLGFDAGIRTLQRTLQGVVRKAARIIVERGFPSVVITNENAKIFLPQY